MELYIFAIPLLQAFIYGYNLILWLYGLVSLSGIAPRNFWTGIPRDCRLGIHSVIEDSDEKNIEDFAGLYTVSNYRTQQQRVFHSHVLDWPFWLRPFICCVIFLDFLDILQDSNCNISFGCQLVESGVYFIEIFVPKMCRLLWILRWVHCANM